MQATQPFFSIVIANFNHGPFLEEALISVLNQSCQDFELIVVDGGSTDGSVDIIKRYAPKLAWWVSEPDSGQSQAFNKGFYHATGQFFFWLNADDLLLAGSLERIRSVINQQPDCLWLAGNTIFFTEEGKVQRCSRGPVWVPWLLKNSPIYVYGPTSIFHRDLFSAVGGFDETLRYSMDTDLWLKFRDRGQSFVRINHYLWGFRWHQGSKTTHSFFGPQIENYALESMGINIKYGLAHKGITPILHTLYKIVSGLYFRAYIDTMRFKGYDIFEISKRLAR